MYIPSRPLLPAPPSVDFFFFYCRCTCICSLNLPLFLLLSTSCWEICLFYCFWSICFLPFLKKTILTHSVRNTARNAPFHSAYVRGCKTKCSFSIVLGTKFKAFHMSYVTNWFADGSVKFALKFTTCDWSIGRLSC